MKLSEYASFDAVGLAELIKSGQVSTQEIRDCALRAVDAVNGEINAVIETYRDPAPVSPDPAPDGPFAGVPFLIKDVGLHYGGLKCEFCSRLCQGMAAAEDSHYARLVKRSGVSIVGRTNTPEFSMSGTSENVSTATRRHRGKSVTPRAGRAAEARRRSRPASCRSHTDPTSAVRSVVPRPGVAASDSSPPVRAYRPVPITTNGVTACP